MKQKKTIANVEQIKTDEFRKINKCVNQVGDKLDLKRYTNTSRIWECPWLFKQVGNLSSKNTSIIDIGTQLSPLPWYLSSLGYDVTIGDVDPKSWDSWLVASRRFSQDIDMRLLDAQSLNVYTSSRDVYLSISVFEHIDQKAAALSEAARVLRPGGYLIMTFDVCEPDMGMSFPDWNGRAMTMEEFDTLISHSQWFDSEVSSMDWNTERIQPYLSWHQKTAPWHNYVTGAAVVRRNSKEWRSSFLRDIVRDIKGRSSTHYMNAKACLNLTYGSIRDSIRSY